MNNEFFEGIHTVITALHLIQINDYYVSKHEMMSDISAVT